MNAPANSDRSLDRRLRHLTFADPATTEADIQTAGINSLEEMDAALARPTKGTVLLDALISTLIACPFMSDIDTDAALMTLLNEPALGPHHLHAMAWASTGQRTSEAPDLLTAICCHPLVDPVTVISSLWPAGRASLQYVSRATGSLLPAAIWWVLSEQNRHSGSRVLTMTSAHLAKIIATARRWESMTAGEPGMASSLATAAFTFTDEATMLAVGRAISAPPTRPRSSNPE